MDAIDILNDLKSDFGKKKLLDTEDLSEVLGKSPHAIRQIKHRGLWTIQTTKFKGKIYVSIYDLADWLADNSKPIASIKSEKPNPTKASSEIKPTTRKTQINALKKSLLMFNQQLDFFHHLHSSLERKYFELITPTTDKKLKRRK